MILKEKSDTTSQSSFIRFSGKSDGTKTLLELMREEGFSIHADCGGRGTCGKCRVRFISCATDALNTEKKLLSAESINAGFRLACQTRIRGDFIIETDNPEEDMDAASVEESDTSEFPRDPMVAIDIGTTTLAVALLDPEKKKVVKAVTGVNHQRIFGADVISRIQAANEGHKDELKRLIREDIQKMISALNVDQTAPAIISANTAMQHLWQGLSCETLGVSPYTPVDLSCRTIEGYTLLPGISTFVGADVVSGIVSLNMDLSDKPCILIDLGTNGEMAIGNKDRIMAASTAAGPAFEGGNISCGTAGIPGAISSVRVEEGFIKYETIGNVPPVGICGSGVIGIIYEMLKKEIIDDTGLLDEDMGEEGFRITDKVFFTQKDVREVQLAKAAVRAGLETLIKAYGIRYDEVDTLYLAGGFGQKIDIRKACGIGLLPGELHDRTEAVGNTSLKGAALFAFDEEVRSRFIKVASFSEEVSLANSREFQEEYIKRMNFEQELYGND